MLIVHFEEGIFKILFCSYFKLKIYTLTIFIIAKFADNFEVRTMILNLEYNGIIIPWKSWI